MVGLKRVMIILVSVLFQIALIALIFISFPKLRDTVVLAFTIMAVFLMLFIIRFNISPDYKLTWIFVIVISPVLGTIIFIASKMNFFKKYKSNIVANDEFIKNMKDDYDKLSKKDISIKKQSHYLMNFANAKIFEKNSTKYYPLGEQLWEDLLVELEKAQKFIFMEYFIVEDGEMLSSILEILERKAREGVDVRLVFDSLGSIFTAPNNFAKNLNESGIKCIPFNRKVRIFNFGFNNRDHRKITVIDSKVAFTGGINIADEYVNREVRFGHWKDTGIMIKGSSVNYFTTMFLTIWGICEKSLPDYDKFLIDDDEVEKFEQSSGFVAPYTDYPGDDEDVGEIMYEEMLSTASDYVYITSPYLILDYNMMNELIIAAKSGVDVRLIVPGIPDKKTVYMLTKSFYAPLLKAGVKIYEYSLGFIHSKQFVSDDKTAIIGTINLDYRSLTHHIENAVWLVETDTVMDIKKDFLKTQKACRKVKIGEKRSSRFAEFLLLPILRAFAPLF